MEEHFFQRLTGHVMGVQHLSLWLLWKTLVFASLTVLINHRSFNTDWRENGCHDLITTPLNPKIHPWNPSGCTMKYFDQGDAIKCMRLRGDGTRNTTMVFMGDSHERGIMSVMIKRLVGEQFKIIPKVYREVSYFDSTSRFVGMYLYRPHFNDSFRNTFEKWEREGFVPDFLIIGCNLHSMLDFNGSMDALHEFRRNLTHHLGVLERVGRKTEILWYLQPPVKDEEVRESHRGISNVQVNLYNNVTKQVLGRSNVRLWTSSRVIAEERMANYYNYIHVGRKVVDIYVQILLNYICNPRMNATDEFCCNTRGDKDTSKISAARFLWGICGPLLMLLTWIQNRYFKLQLNETELKGSNPVSQNYKAIIEVRRMDSLPEIGITATKCLIYLGYIYLCDGTLFFPSTTSGPSFSVLIGAILVGLLLTQGPTLESTPSVSSLMQEFRGVLMCLLLVMEPFELSTREYNRPTSLFWSLLLTLAGMEFFGDLRGKQWTNLRFYLVNISSITLLPSLLCLMLNQSFQSYEMMPELLMFFHLFYFAFKIPFLTWKQEELARNLAQDLARWICVGMFSIGITMYKSQIFSFVLLKPFVATQEGTLTLWLQRWDQYKYSYSVGVLFGIIYENRIIIKSIFGRIIPKETKMATRLLMLAFLGLSFTYLSFILPHRVFADVKTSHQRLQFIVLVVCYIILRMGFLKFWNTCSALFMCLGVLWIEISLLHNHIWMKYDGTSFIQLTSSHSLINAGILFSMLVFTCADFRSLILRK